MPTPEKDKYFVAVKVFLEKDGQLLILKDNFGDWDLPGGRLKKDEFEVSLEKIVARKMGEELGDEIEYTLGKPIVFLRHERVEQTPGNPTVRIFAVGYQADYKGGKIKLSLRHTRQEWVEINSFAPEKYFAGGWLKGVQEYLVIKRSI